jgi:hypothetical protein
MSFMSYVLDNCTVRERLAVVEARAGIEHNGTPCAEAFGAGDATARQVEGAPQPPHQPVQMNDGGIVNMLRALVSSLPDVDEERRARRLGESRLSLMPGSSYRRQGQPILTFPSSATSLKTSCAPN